MLRGRVPSVLGPIPLTSSGWPNLNLKVQYCNDNDLDAARLLFIIMPNDCFTNRGILTGLSL